MMLLLAALGANIKPAGRDRWTAKCPVHNDKDFAMSIRLMSDQSVIAHCHACCANGLDLYRHLNLDMDELFGGKQREWRPSQEIIDSYEMDRIVVKIYEHDVSQGRVITLKDKRRHKLAVNRIAGIERKIENIQQYVSF